MELQKFKAFKDAIINNVGHVIVGKQDVIEKIIVSIICGGHILIKDVPGLAKTKLTKAVAGSMALSFARVQFTPDLLPSDLTGIYYFNQKESEFVFRQGPLFNHFILADEINRATPRTQSALLECMEERQITVEGHTHKLSSPFMVMATQNPIEQLGTFPLPEAQRDRFFMSLSMGYPTHDEEKEILNYYKKEDPLDKLAAVTNQETIMELQSTYHEVYLSEAIKDYIVHIVHATREDSNIVLGASPRGSLALMRAACAYAAISGRDYVLPEDVKKMVVPILSHRLLTGSGSDTEAVDCLNQILEKVPAPLEKI